MLKLSGKRTLSNLEEYSRLNLSIAITLRPRHLSECYLSLMAEALAVAGGAAGIDFGGKILRS
jgi:hypothetical protein